MGRWTQYDEDEYRLGGLKRTAYDADTQTYTFSDSHGIRYKGVPGSEYEIAGRVKEKNIAAERPEAFADGKKRPSKINVDDTPYRFEDFLPPTAITSPTSSPSDPSAGKSTSRFFDAARRAALPKLQGVVQGLRRSATTRKVTPDDEKRGLLRPTQSVASANSSVFPDEKQSFMGRGRAKTASDCETPRRTFTLRQPSTAPTPRRDSEAPVRERNFSLRRTKDKEMEEKGKGRVSEMKAEDERRVVSSSSSRRSEDKVNRNSSSKDSKHSHSSSRRHSEDKGRRVEDIKESPKEHTSSRSHRRYASEAPPSRSKREDEQERVKRLDRLAGLPVPIAPPFNAAEPPVPETSKHHHHHHHHHHSSESRKEHRSDRERRHHHHERSASKLVAA